MRQCTHCLSENVLPVVERDRVYYLCRNCNSVQGIILDNTSNLYEEKSNGLIKHITVGALIVRKEKIFLLNRRNFPYGFGVPAKHLKSGENIEETLARTVSEETGYILKEKELIFHDTLKVQCRYNGELHEWYLFECKTAGNLVLQSEVNNGIWVTKNEIAKLPLVDSTMQIFTQLGFLGHSKPAIKTNLDHKVSTSEVKKTKEPEKARIKNIEESVVENLPIAVILYNSDGKFTFNKNAERILASLEDISKNEYDNFMFFISDMAKRVIDSKTELASNIRTHKSTYYLMASPLFSNDKIYGVSLVLNNTTQNEQEKMKDFLSLKTSYDQISSENYNNIIKITLKQLLVALDVESSNLMLIDKDKLKVTFRYSSKSSDRYKPFNLKLGEGVAGWVAKHNLPLAIPDTSKDSLYVKSKRSKPKSLLSVPITAKKNIYGVLNLSRPKMHYFTEDEVKMVTIIANRIALNLENEKFYNQAESEKNMLEKVLASTNDGIALINKEGKFVFANSAFRRFLGMDSKDDAILELLQKNNSKKNIEIMREKFFFSIKNKKTVSWEIESEANKHYRVLLNPIIERNGNCKSVLIVVNDITKLKQKQHTISKHLEEITSLFKISSISVPDTSNLFSQVLQKTSKLIHSERMDIILFDKNQKHQWFSKNQNDRKIVEEIILNHSISNGFISNNLAKDLPEFTDVEKIKVILSPLEVRGETKGVVYAINNKTNYFANDLKMLTIVGYRIARRLENDEWRKEIENDRRKIAEIIENSGEGILVLDAKGNVILWNKEMENIRYIAGFENFSSGRICRIKSNKKVSQIFIPPLEVINGTKNLLNTEMKIKNCDNQDLWLDITYSSVKNNGKIEYVIAIIRDVSKEKEIENYKDDFIYTATHELRTPITTIKGYLSMIMNGDAGEVNPKQANYFQKVYDSTEKLVGLVEDLLQAMKLEENGVIFDTKVINPHELMFEVISDHLQKAKNKKIEMNLNKKENFEILGDFQRVKQAFSNLIDNAIKYTLKGKIEINLKKQCSNFALISISDTGIGISRKDRAMVFNKFYRTSNSRSARVGGTGLGLFIVKNLIEKQGGKVWVESELRKGSTFNVLLPLAKTKGNK